MFNGELAAGEHGRMRVCDELFTTFGPIFGKGKLPTQASKLQTFARLF